MEYIAAIFFCFGAIDFLLGSKWGLGQAFLKGLNTITDLILWMCGFIIFAPWISSTLAPLISPVFVRIGCDPSLFAGMMLSSDAGGAILAEQLAQSEIAGLYNGMIIGSFMGPTIVCTIPLSLKGVNGDKKQAVVQGLLLGFITIPFGCVITGIIAGIPWSVIISNTWPVIVVVTGIILLFHVCRDKVAIFFQLLAFMVRAIALAGLSIEVIQEAFHFFVITGLTPLREVFPIICNIGVFLAGILVLTVIIEKRLSKIFVWIAHWLHISDVAVLGFLVSIANSFPVMNDLKNLDERSCVFSVAFLTSAGFAIGDHLAFAVQFKPEIAIELMFGKILAGILGIILAVVCMKPKNTSFLK